MAWRCKPISHGIPLAVALGLMFLMVCSPSGASSPAHLSILLANGKALQIFHSETDLVVLPITVTDHKGKAVSGLSEQDFRVYENGRLQTISSFDHNDVPVTVGLVLDSSGSMRPRRPEVALAAEDFLNSSNPQDQVFVINFNEMVSLGLPPSMPFTSNVAELKAAVLKGPFSGLTALYDATWLALKHLSLGTNPRKALVIVSDGGDDASHEEFRDVLTLARHSNAIIYTVGIVSRGENDVNPGLLRKLAKATGGTAYFAKTPADLPDICQQIARDLRQQYTIAYIPSDKLRDGKYRAIRISVHAPGKGSLVARTRTGYFAPSGPAETASPLEAGSAQTPEEPGTQQKF